MGKHSSSISDCRLGFRCLGRGRDISMEEMFGLYTYRLPLGFLTKKQGYVNGGNVWSL